jgi:hypothetical protein
MGKRRERQHRSPPGGALIRPRSERSRHTSNDKPVPLVSVTDDGPAGRWEKHLPQAESDGTIGENVKGMLDYIPMHVENYYRDKMVTITDEMRNNLMDPNVNSPLLEDSVAGLLTQTRTPTKLIKHCIARSIINHISPDSDISDSFLPSDFVTLPRKIAQKEKVKEHAKTKTGELYTLNRTDDNADHSIVFNPALSRWRQVSAYLRPDPKEDQAYIAEREKNIAKVADSLCHAFDPWADPSFSFEARRKHLGDLMRSAAETGILLFSQPSTFSYRWKTPSDREKRSGNLSIVLSPGFVKVRDGNGEEMERHRVLLRPVTDTIFG